MFRLLSRIGIDSFVLGMLGMVALAWATPEWGRSGGLLRMDLVAIWGVVQVFMFYGLTLHPERLRAGILNWRLHLLVQTATFVFYPLLMLGAISVLSGRVHADLLLGFFYLAALPSTVSSSVTMTSIAGGNVAGAIFNAILSSLLGVILTPLWVSWYLSTSGGSMDLVQVLTKVFLLVVAPVIVGQLLRPHVQGWVDRNEKWLKSIDRITILLIVYNSFADSVAGGMWETHGSGVVIQVAIGVVVLFFLVFGLLQVVCRVLRFPRDDAVAGVFCGTKKSMATGVPMAKIMFGTSPVLGMVILPVILYHLFQLVVAGIVARRWQRRPGQDG